MMYRADLPMQSSYTKPLPLHFQSEESSEGGGEMADEGVKVAMEYSYSGEEKLKGGNKNETVIGIDSAGNFLEEKFDDAEEARQKKKQRLMEPDSADNMEEEDIPNPKQSVEMARDAEKTHVFEMEYVLDSEHPTGTPIEVDPKKFTETEEVMLSDDNDNIDDEEEDKQEEARIDVETRLTVEGEPDSRDENMVLRTLLREPRYFEPSAWMTCYKCGEDYHSRSCKVKKKRKPCYICGNFGHNGKRCLQVRKCFICSNKGHLSKDCPKDQPEEDKFCLKCGNFGHDIFSCTDEYCPEDLKNTRCYICKEFGHLCCAEYRSEGPRHVSCFKCGHLGHSGFECDMKSKPPCSKCGERGHQPEGCDKSPEAGGSGNTENTPANKKSTKNRKKKKKKQQPINVPQGSANGNVVWRGTQAPGQYFAPPVSNIWLSPPPPVRLASNPCGGSGNTENTPANKKSTKNRKKKKKKQQPINVPQGSANGNIVWRGTQAPHQYFAPPVSNIWLSPPPSVQLASNPCGNQYFSQHPRQYFNHHIGTRPPQSTLNYQTGRQIPHQIYNHQQTLNHQIRAQYPCPIFPPRPQQNFNHHSCPQVQHRIYNHHTRPQVMQQLLNHWSRPQFPLQNFNHQTRPQAPH